MLMAHFTHKVYFTRNIVAYFTLLSLLTYITEV